MSFVPHRRRVRPLIGLLALASALVTAGARADSPLGVTVSLLGTEGGILGVPADTSVPFYVDGWVTDPRGDDIEGVAVSDGTQSTKTLKNGTWSLPEPVGSPYVITVKSDRTDTAAFRAPAPGVPGLYGVALTLPYTIGVSGWSVSGSQATVTVFSSAPSPGIPGQTGKSCVSVVDTATTATTAATFTGTTDPCGAFLWSASIPSAVQRVRVRAADCARGTGLTDRAAVSHPLTRDAQAPSGQTVWFNSANPVIAFSATDSGGSGVNPDSAGVVVDGIALATGNNPAFGLTFEAQARGLADGLHAAQISIADYAGNLTTFSFVLAVDTTVPAASNPAPSDVVTGSSPKITLAAADGDSGVDPSASRFIITNGVVASTLRPSFDAGAGTLSYQVPAFGLGPNLGQGPLPPGFYTVDAFVQDHAGNESRLSFFFAVLPF